MNMTHNSSLFPMVILINYSYSIIRKLRTVLFIFKCSYIQFLYIKISCIFNFDKDFNPTPTFILNLE